MLAVMPVLLAGCAGGASTGATSGAAASAVASQAVPSPGATASAGRTAASQSPSRSSASPSAACDPRRTVVPQTPGPFYRPGAPRREDITDPGTFGNPLVLTGRVYDARCRPVAGAVLDVWQADGAGEYDNTGFRLRGVLTTGPDGGYRLTTVVPGQYPGRTEHIHVRITPPGAGAVVTQLYFPGSERNEEDGIFVPSMVVTVDRTSASGMAARFDFVIP